MGYQRRNLSEAFDIHIEREGNETNDISLIFFVMDIPPECMILYTWAGERPLFFPKRSVVPISGHVIR